MSDSNIEGSKDDEKLEFKAILKNQGLIKGLESKHFFTASKIQRLVCLEAENEKSIVIQAKAGMGKTLAFSCCFLDTLFIQKDEKNEVKVLIVAPTREIAHQISQVIASISSYMEPVPPIVGTFIGGTSIAHDQELLQSCHIAVGTPGRLKSLVNSNHLKTSSISTLILDEADRLMQFSFQSDIKFLVSKLPQNKRIIVASATFDSSVLKGIERDILPPNPQYFMVDGADLDLGEIQQKYYKVDLDQKEMASPILQLKIFQKKTEALKQILSNVKFYQAIIFLNNQARSQELVKKLETLGWPAAYTSGHLDQSERLIAMDKTRLFSVRVLVCSDLISRGVDVERVDLVINLDLPRTAETYLHRVGRTGRFGTAGLAISLVGSETELAGIKVLQDDYGMPLKQIDTLDGLSSTGRRMLNREDVAAFSKLKIAQEQARKNPPAEESFSECLTSPNLKRPREVATENYEALLFEDESGQKNLPPDSNLEESSYHNHEYYYASQSSPPNPFYEFWLKHFCR